MTALSTSRRKSDIVPFACFCAALLAVLIPAVLSLQPSAPRLSIEQVVHEHHKGKNVIIAEKMIAGLLPLPPSRWSHEVVNGEIGRGVWYASGGVLTLSPMGDKVLQPWKAVFLPATSQSLYLSIGGIEKGNYIDALLQAGVQPEHP